MTQRPDPPTRPPTPELEGERVLVTGGAGFIGSHLVDALLEHGARVRVLDNLATGRKENLSQCLDQIDYREGDIRDAAACREACRDVAFVFHQAALGSVPRSLRDPATTVAVNVGGTANIYAAARDAGVKRVIYASSSSVYGDTRTLPNREGEEGSPLSPYALTKVMNEELASVFGRCYRMEFIGLRYFNVFGPRQDPDGAYAAVIPRFFRAYSQGVSPKIYGDGEQSRDFTFVEDAVSANLLAAAAGKDACGQAYNVAGGRSVTVNEIATRVRDTLGGGPTPRHEQPRDGDVRHSRADLSSAGRALGYSPLVGVADGLRRTGRHFSGDRFPHQSPPDAAAREEGRRR